MFRYPPFGFAGLTFTSTGQPLRLHPLDPSSNSFRRSLPSPLTASYIPPTTTPFFSYHRPHTTSSGQARTAPCPPLPTPPRVYVPVLMYPWVLHTCHILTSCRLGVARLAIWVLLGHSACLCASIGGSAGTSPPTGSSAAASSDRRARLRSKQFACLPFPCHHQTAPEFSSALTISARYPLRLGEMPT